MAPQPFGRELNGRQRILDLVSQTPRHFAPRGHLLRANQRRHIVEHQHDALGRPRVADERRRNGREMHLLPFPRQRDVIRGRLHLAVSGTGQHLAKRLQVRPVEDGQRGLSDNLPVQTQEPRGGAVDRRNRA